MNVLIIEDEQALAAALSLVARRLGAEPTVAASGQSGIQKLANRSFDLIVLDIGLPDMNGLEVLRRLRSTSEAAPVPVLVITAHGTLDNALDARRLGAADYFLKPLDLAEFQQALCAYLKITDAPATKPAPAAPLKPERGSTVMIGAAPTMQKAYAAIAQACGTRAPLLITGASGTGRSLAARVIHSDRAPGGPFVSFRIDEWPSEQLQHALFGNAAEPGALRKAAGGTLFISDIATLPLPQQAALEQALKEAEGNFPLIVAATSHDLAILVRDDRFRADLYYTLKIVEVSLPPLIARTGDIPALAGFFLSQTSAGTRGIALSDHALAALKAHDWPGNVRELRNAMQHAAAVCTGPLVLPRHLPEAIARRAADAAPPGRNHLDDALRSALAGWLDHKLTAPGSELPPYDSLAEQIESMVLKELLPRFENKPTRLATAMQMNRATLRRKCREFL